MLAAFDELTHYDDRQTDGYLLYQRVSLYDITSLLRVSREGNNSHRFGLFTSWGEGALGWTCTYYESSGAWSCGWYWIPESAFKTSPLNFDD